MGLPLMLIPCRTSSKFSIAGCSAWCAFLVLDHRSGTICMMIKQSTEYFSVLVGHGIRSGLRIFTSCALSGKSQVLLSIIIQYPVTLLSFPKLALISIRVFQVCILYVSKPVARLRLVHSWIAKKYVLAPSLN